MSNSIASRFAFSFAANLMRSLVTFGTGMMIARGLGPEDYGRMMFLIGTFAAVRQLMDMGTSTAFYTFLSRKQRNRRFVLWYGGWLAIQFVLPLIAIALIFPSTWIDLIWKGEQRLLVILAFAAAFFQYHVWTVVMQMGESQRLTRRVQATALVLALVHLSVISVSWWQGWLSIPVIFVAIVLEWAVAVALVLKHMHFPSGISGEDSLKSVATEFYHYCLPLIPYAWVGFAYEFADRWLLQSFGGSVQQAYYAVAFQFGAVAAIATSSTLNVLWKEIAEANHNGDSTLIAALYRRISRMLFFIAASVAGFLVPWTEEILLIVLGPAYVGGSVALAIMFLYPMHQSMGQVGGTMLYATGRVRAQVVFGLIFMAASIVVSYFVLAPASAAIPGFQLGALGLAGKMVVMQLLSVNAIALYLAFQLRIRFDWLYQPVHASLCLGTGWVVCSSSKVLLGDTASHWLTMPFAGVLYALVMIFIIWQMPALVGTSRSELKKLIAKIQRRR